MSMTQIYSSELQEIYYDKSKSLIKNIWLAENISFEEMKKEMKNWMDNFNQTKAKYMLTDSSLGIIVPPKTQDWIVDFLFPTVIEKGILKYAILLSEEIFSQVSVEQMFDEKKVTEEDNFQQFFFDKSEEKKALDWLNSNE